MEYPNSCPPARQQSALPCSYWPFRDRRVRRGRVGEAGGEGVGVGAWESIRGMRKELNHGTFLRASERSRIIGKPKEHGI